MQRIEEMQPAKGRADRQRILLRKARDAIARLLRPAAAAQDQHRRLRGAEKLRELRHLRRPRRRLDRQIRRRIIDADTLGQHVLGQADDDRPRPAVGRRIESARDDFRYARRVLDLGRPLGHRAEHGAIVDFLKRLAVAHVACHLANKHDERRRILTRDVNAGRSIGGAWPARNKTDTGPAGRLAHRLRHHRCAAFLAAHGDGKVAVVKGIEHGEITLARNAEYVTHAVDPQLIHQNLGGGANIVLPAHRHLRDGARLAAPRVISFDCREMRR